MKHHPIRNRVAALALVLQVLAVFGTARGLVLCVGPAGHVAVEDAQAAVRCRASQGEIPDTPTNGRPTVAASPACSDTPVFEAAPNRTVSAPRFEGLAVAATLAALFPQPAATAPVARRWSQPRPLETRRLRTIVLLI